MLLGHDVIGGEHILLDLTHKEEGAAARAVASLRVDQQVAPDTIAEIIVPRSGFLQLRLARALKHVTRDNEHLHLVRERRAIQIRTRSVRLPGLRVTGGPMPRSGILVAVKEPGRTMHWWYSKADRARIERLSDQIDEAHRRAETASDEERRYLRPVRRLERTRRTQRMYPSSIWFWGASIVVVILPWSILARAGQPGIGWTISAVALVGIIFVRWRLKQRQNEHDEPLLAGSDEESA